MPVTIVTVVKRRFYRRAPRKRTAAGLWSRGMVATLGAQFLSALADNALLFAALGLVRKLHYPVWSGPLIQEFFVAAYILLAPFVGALADAQPKGRVMAIANVAKFLGAFGMCMHMNPFVCYALVGAGAAANSPAKYGILGELTTRERLLKANSLLEAATIAAILLGAAAGGVLTDWSIEGALMAISVCYAASALSALLIPPLKRAAPITGFSIATSLRDFATQARSLMRGPKARLAVVGTALFWGVGAALRFLVIAWVPAALKITSNKVPGFLTAMVAVGIVLGAALAARFVRLPTYQRALPAGVLIGIGVCLLPFAKSVSAAVALMIFVGTCSGFFIVPLDALLQRQGEDGVGVGSAIAIQNLYENFSMLALVAGYTAATYTSVPVNDIAVGLGLFIALSMGALTLMRR